MKKYILPILVFALVSGTAIAAPPTEKYQPGETIDPSCAPGDTNCDIEFTQGDATNDAWVNNLTDGRIELEGKSDGAARDQELDFVITDEGKVGIGTIPDKPLTVKGGAHFSGGEFDIFPHDNNATTFFDLNNTAVAPVSSHWRIFTGDYTDGSNDGFGIRHFLKSGGSLSRLHIANDGKVGLGLDSPEYQLDVKIPNESTKGLRVSTEDNDISRNVFLNLQDRAFVEYDGAYAAMRLKANDGKMMIFETDGDNERMRIGLNGNIGVGTTDLSQGKFTVDGNIWGIGDDNPFTLYGRNRDVRLNIDLPSYDIATINTVDKVDSAQRNLGLQTEGGGVGIGTISISDGTANGGQPLNLDVEGAIGASYYCDENGENCSTIEELFSDIESEKRAGWTQESGATGEGMWAKIMTIDLASHNYQDGSFLLALSTEETGAPGTAFVDISIRQGTVDNYVFVLRADVMNKSNSNILKSDSIKIIADEHGGTSEVYIQNAASHQGFNVYELASNHEFNSVKYEQGAVWSATEPIGTYEGVSKAWDITANDIWADKITANKLTAKNRIFRGDSEVHGTVDKNFGIWNSTDFVHYDISRCVDVGTGLDPNGHCDGLGRVFVHNFGDRLTFNYGGDFDGGTFIDGVGVGIGNSVLSDGTSNGGRKLKLDVNGAVGASHYCDENGGNCTAASALGSSGGTADNLGNHTATENIILGTKYLSGDGDDEGVFVDQYGQIGIGIASGIQEKIHVLNGGIRVDGGINYVRIDDNSLNFNRNGTSYVRAKNIGGALGFSVNGDANTAMRIDEGGRVGIGTSTPSSKLQVKSGYMQIDTSSGIPPASDCDRADYIGRMKVDENTDDLYVCFASGWVTK